jgi:hypothetical protein
VARDTYNKPDTYTRADAEYQKRPEQMAKRVMRNKARRHMIAKLGKEALEGKDIDHIKMLDKGGSNDPVNWRVSGVKANRNWRKGKHGY